MTDTDDADGEAAPLKPRSEWAPELESYGARYERDAPVMGDNLVAEVWKARGGETFVVPYTLSETGEREVDQETIDRLVRMLLAADPAAN